jgi:hypothetical protein
MGLWRGGASVLIAPGMLAGPARPGHADEAAKLHARRAVPVDFFEDA